MRRQTWSASRAQIPTHLHSRAASTASYPGEKTEGNLPEEDAVPAAPPQRFSRCRKGKRAFLQSRPTLPISGTAAKGRAGWELSLQTGSSQLGEMHVVPHTGRARRARHSKRPVQGLSPSLTPLQHEGVEGGQAVGSCGHPAQGAATSSSRQDSARHRGGREQGSLWH